MAHTRKEFQNAISYLSSQNAIVFSNELFLDANARKLYDESHNESTGVRISNVDITPDEPTLTQALVDLAIQESNQQSSNAVQAGAKAQMQAIPNWASWTEAQALNFYDVNVTDEITNVTNLAEAKAMLAQMATAQRNIIRMTIALRNEALSDLQQ